MQFSVIVEGPMDSNASSEDSLLELERFLRASEIPTQTLKDLKQGQSKVVRNKLSYEQAVSISDRLMDLGLESFIDPPPKPEPSAPPAPSLAYEHRFEKYPNGLGGAQARICVYRLSCDSD